MVLGLVEPQSSGLGGGLFITYFDIKNNRTYSYEGRETSPKKFLTIFFSIKKVIPKKFFDAALGGQSVGVPATLKTLKFIHKDFGSMKWKKIIDYVIKFSEKGFFPSPRLINALKKEKHLFKLNPNSVFKQILKHPKKNLLMKNIQKH